MADKFFDAMFTASVIGGSSGPAPVIVSKNITANGTYSALDDQADGYNPIIVDVPNTYTAADEGKVVSGGALVAQTSTTATTNGTINTTTNNEVVVNVPNTYTAGDEGKVVSGGALVAQTSTTCNTNGTINTTTNNEVVVNVPNTYTAGDEGKVVSSGALVAQTSATYTTNNTYDTTLINSVTVNVPTGTTIYDFTDDLNKMKFNDLHCCAINNRLYIFGQVTGNNSSDIYAYFTVPPSTFGITQNISAYISSKSIELQSSRVTQVTIGPNSTSISFETSSSSLRQNVIGVFDIQ